MAPTIRRFLAFLAVLWGAGAAILIMDTFLTAYVRGGSVLVEINAVGEMWPEFLILAVVAPTFAVGLYYAVEHLGGGR